MRVVKDATVDSIDSRTLTDGELEIRLSKPMYENAEYRAYQRDKTVEEYIFEAIQKDLIKVPDYTIQ